MEKEGFLGPKLEMSLTLVTVLSICFAAYSYLDSRHAKTIDVTVLNTRLELKIKEDLENSALVRVWALEDRAAINSNDKEILVDLREAKVAHASYQEDVKLLKAALVNNEQN